MFVASIYPEKMCSEAAKAYVCQTTSSWFTPVFSIKKKKIQQPFVLEWVDN